MIETELDVAKKVLCEFMERMCQWETFYHDLFSREDRDFEKDKTDAKNKLLEIYSAFVTKRERKTGRLHRIHAGYPSEFDDKRDEIISVENITDKKIAIFSKWNDGLTDDFYENRKYTMTKQKDLWLLDKVEAFNDYSQKWENRPL